MFQYSIYDMHFGIIKSALIWAISVVILSVFRDKLFLIISARRQIRSLANKNKDLVRIELTNVFTGSFHYCQSEYEAASVNF